MHHIRRIATAWLLALAASGCAPLGPSAPPGDERDGTLFERWAEPRASALQALRERLRADGVDDVVALEQLLRSASDWRRCGAEPYALPPVSQWPAMVSVLRLLRELRAAGVLGEFDIRSGWRDAELNRCADGAPRSAHLVAFAVDLVPQDAARTGDALCRWWQREGRARAMGLGRYPSGRVHLDTHGWRTWGEEAPGQPFCARPATPQPG